MKNPKKMRTQASNIGDLLVPWGKKNREFAQARPSGATFCFTGAGDREAAPTSDDLSILGDLCIMT